MSSAKILKFGTSSIGKVGSNVVGFDPYFQASRFITVANITDTTQQDAVKYLVQELVDNNLMSKFNFIYPMVGGDATKHSYNLVNPSSYQLTFFGGWTHSTNGATPNGTNAYATTGFIPLTHLKNSNNAHLSYYSRTNLQKGNEYVIGGGVGTNPTFYLRIRDQNNAAEAGIGAYRVNQPLTPNGTITNSLGLFMGNFQNFSSRQVIRNKTVLITNTVTQANTLLNIQLYFGAYNDNGTTIAYTDKQCAFASVGDGMSNVEQELFYDIVQEFQTILGRNV